MVLAVNISIVGCMVVKKYKRFSILGLALLIIGCVATQSLDDIIGTGRVDIAQRTWKHFQKYKDLPDGGCESRRQIGPQKRSDFLIVAD